MGEAFKHEPGKICGRQSSRNWSNMVCFSRPYHFKFFKGCLPQILRGPFLNTLSQIIHKHIFTVVTMQVFIAAALFLYPLKTSESQMFLDVSRGYRNRPMVWNRLRWEFPKFFRISQNRCFSVHYNIQRRMEDPAKHLFLKINKNFL